MARNAECKRWKKLPGNDGTVRLAVPAELAVPRETPPGTSRETSRDMLPQALAALETAVTTLTQQLTGGGGGAGPGSSWHGEGNRSATGCPASRVAAEGRAA
jgi:hypothetical protein